jgi:hypothetical protein
LQLPQRFPTEAVDDVVLKRGIETVECTHGYSSISSTDCAETRLRSTSFISPSARVRA